MDGDFISSLDNSFQVFHTSFLDADVPEMLPTASGGAGRVWESSSKLLTLVEDPEPFPIY